MITLIGSFKRISEANLSHSVVVKNIESTAQVKFLCVQSIKFGEISYVSEYYSLHR